MKHRISGSAESASRIADKEKPPRQNLGGEKEPIGWASALERVAALPIRGLGRRDGQAHLPAPDPGDKSSHRVSLPAGGFHQIRPGSATRALQQVKELGGFAALAHRAGLLARLGRRRACVGFVRTGGLGRPSLGRRDVPRVCGNVRLFGGRGLHGWAMALVVSSFFWNLVHIGFLLGGDDRDGHINRSNSSELQAESCATPHDPGISEGFDAHLGTGGGR
jgi:hypothetical protein